MTKTSINYVGRLAKKCGHQIMTRNYYLISVYSDRYKEIKNKIIEKVEKVKKSYESKKELRKGSNNRGRSNRSIM